MNIRKFTTHGTTGAVLSWVALTFAAAVWAQTAKPTNDPPSQSSTPAPTVTPNEAPIAPTNDAGAAAQPPLPQPPTEGPEAIRQSQPSFLVRVAVDRASRSYREDDQLSLTV